MRRPLSPGVTTNASFNEGYCSVSVYVSDCVSEIAVCPVDSVSVSEVKRIFSTRALRWGVCLPSGKLWKLDGW